MQSHHHNSQAISTTSHFKATTDFPNSLAPPESPASRRRKTSLAQNLILQGQLRQRMSQYGAPEGAYGQQPGQGQPGAGGLGGYGAQGQGQVQGQGQYGAEQQQPGAGYGEQQGQYGAEAQQGAYGQQQQQQQQGQPGAEGQQGQYGVEAQQGAYGQQQQGQPGAERQQNGEPQGQGTEGNNGRPGQEQNMNGRAQEPKQGQGSQHPGASSALSRTGQPDQAGKAGQAGRPAVAPGMQNHTHSRFAQDPHHHGMMQQFHKIASEGMTADHLHSFVHLGSLGLAYLAHNAGMTHGHEPEEEKK
jgi:hypothetical protein